MMPRRHQPRPWGTDGGVSIPPALETTDTDMVDMGGFCFTPDGLQINVSRSEREQLIHEAYRPQVNS